MSRVVLVRSTLQLWDLVVVISAGVLASLGGWLSMEADSVPVFPVAGAIFALGGAVALWRCGCGGRVCSGCGSILMGSP